LDQPALTDKKLQQDMLRYSQDLAALVRNNKALNNGSFSHLKTAVNKQHNLLFVHRWQEDNEVIAVMNYGNQDLKSFALNSFGIFPQGTWEEVLNSNDPNYGGNGQNLNSSKRLSQQQSDVSIPKQSMLILKRVS
jgi:1,4-alpha-glucan branching enzyme